ADRPALSANRHPDPAKRPTAHDIAVTRGRIPWRYRQARTIRAFMPRWRRKASRRRAIFDAVEQARVEAIGARAMAGVADNLSTMLADKYQPCQFFRCHDEGRCAAGRGGVASPA
ncbi:hypothetical protein VXQ18_02365, partial [Brucella abortus]|nr:hypothetical protein [Brucella abortus]